MTPEWIRNWRAALSDAELYCERHDLEVEWDGDPRGRIQLLNLM